MQNPEQGAIEISRIKQLIVKAGDEGCDYFKRDLTKLADELTDYYLLNRLELRDAIVQFLQEAISLFPLKSGVYATLVALLLIKQTTASLAEQIIQSSLDLLQHIWLEQSPLYGTNIMSFLGELMNIGLINSVNYVECLYDLEGGAETEKYPFYLRILLSTLPHIMIKATEKNQIEFKNIIQNVESLMNKREKITETDELDLLWNATRQFLNAGLSQADQTLFLQKSYPRPYFLFTEEMAQVKQIRKNFKIAINKREKGWYPQPILIFTKDYLVSDPKVFMMQEIVRQWIHETIILFKSNKMLLVMQFDQYSKYLGLSPIQEATLKKLTTQALINKMIDVKPSNDEMSTIFYSSVLVALAQRENKNDFLEYVEQCVDECLLRHGDDIVILDLLAEFLSHFLSNISLKWGWDKVHSLVNGESGEVKFAQNYFVFQFLRKLFSMIQQAKIKDLISKELLTWYEQYPDQYKPNSDTKRFDEHQQHQETMNQLLQTKTSSEEVSQKLQELGGDSQDSLIFSFDIFTERLILRMSASITHLNVLSKRYKNLYSQDSSFSRELVQDVLLKNLLNIWGHSSFHLTVYIQEWYNLGLIRLQSLVKWVLERPIDNTDFKNVNLNLSLLSLFKQTFSNVKNNSSDEMPQEDLNYEELQNCFHLLNQSRKDDKHIIQKIQLYVLGIVAVLKFDYGSLVKQLKEDGKHEKEYTTSILMNIS